MDRRHFLGRAGAGGLALGLHLAGCGRQAPTSDEGEGGEFRGQTLTIFVYSGIDKALQDCFVVPFERRTGATVVLEPGWWDAIAKLKASPKGKPAFDLILTDATQGYPAIKDGLFRTIDVDRIPNLARLSPAALDNWVARGRHGVTFPEAAMSLAYRKDLVGGELTGWGDLLRDDLRGKLSLYDSFYMSLYTFACMKVAAEGRPGTASEAIDRDLDGVLDYAKRERRRVRSWWPASTTMSLDLVQGNCAAGNAHSSAILRVAREDGRVGVVTPEADRAYVQLMWVIAEGTSVPALAEAAIDAILGPDVQAALARRGMATPRPDVASRQAAEDPAWAATYPTTDRQWRELRYFPYEAYFRHWDQIVRVWDREVLRGG